MTRFAATGYAAIAFFTRPEPYQRPWLGWLVIAGMLTWSIYVAVQPRRPGRLIAADLVIATLTVLATPLVDTRELASATNTLPLIFPVAAVMSWAVWRGAVWGVAAAAVIGVADLLVVDPITRRTVHNCVLLVFAGGLVGFAATLYERTRRDMAAALESAAAARERERLARDIHDSVLQVLAFVQRRGSELGGEASELGRMAGEQERLLRGLITGRAIPGAHSPQAGSVDVLGELRALETDLVRVSGPAGPVLLDAAVAGPLLDAVRACLSNVGRHAGDGATAYLLLEDEGREVTVSVRDDGVGFAADRLDHAVAEGRLGVAGSIRGRIGDLGGRVEIWSAPGQGVEVELVVPRR